LSDAAPGPGLSFGLLGPLLVHDGERERTVPAGRLRSLLAALLLGRGRVVSRDALVAAVWGDRPPPSADRTLYSYVNRLREALGPRAADRVRTSPAGYLLALHPGELDLDRAADLLTGAHADREAGRWEAVRAACTDALDLWRGEPLIDVGELADRAGEQHRLTELRLQTVETRIAADLALGRHAALVGEVAALCRAHPFRERFAALHMLVLYGNGRQHEALAAYGAIRQTLLAEAGLEPGPDLRDLHRRILRADPDLLPARPPAPDPAAVPPAPVLLPTPAQLPPAPADFTGRQDAVDRLTALLGTLAPAGPTQAVAVTGPGGVGKSALAVHTAHLLRRLFPDGQLFVRLDGADRPGRTGEVQQRFLRGLGLPTAALPTDPVELTALYRSVTSSRRLLVLVDDARTGAELEQLRPTGPGSALLATSRTLLPDLPGLHLLPLDALDPAHCHELLGRIAGPARMAAEPAAVASLVRSCAGLPLAVRIAGARLATRPGRPVRLLADQLADARTRLDLLAIGDLNVRASFQVSFDALEGTELPRALALLSQWSGAELSAAAAAALLARPPAAAEALLEQLVDLNLLETPRPSRYRLHDLVRLCAAERASAALAPDARTSAAHRLVTWYAHSVAALDAAIAPNRRRVGLTGEPAAPLPPLEDRTAALAWFEAEQANLAAVVQLSAGLADHPHTWQLAVASWGAFLGERLLPTLLDCHELGLAGARAAGDRDAEAWILNGLGAALLELRRHHEAEPVLAEALAIRREIGDTAGEGLTLNNLAVLAHRRSDITAVLSLLHSAVALHRRTGNRDGEAMALSNLGQMLPLPDRAAEAVASLHEALAIRRALGDDRATSMVLDGLGVVHRRTGALDPALAALDEAVLLARPAGARHAEAMCLLNRAQVLAELGQPERARTDLVRARELFTALGAAEQAAEAAALLTGAGQP
jgi:DNA-binding SARP family transcriptional activator/tetratricopeptide (TPR) repeat protein